jgi:hypothetical protein
LDKGETQIAENATTGAQKEINDVRFDLIPVEALWEVARVYGVGARKYDDNNWRRGYRWSNSYAAMQRHAARFWAGESMDEAGFRHLAAVAWHALALLTFENEFPEGDDRFVR